MSSKDITEKHLMHSKRDNRDVLTGKKFESSNKTIALNVLFVENKRQEIKQAYISKYNSVCKDKVDILMIIDSKKWHDLAVKKLSTLLRGITTNQDDDYCCINCRYLIRTDYDKKRKK